eukprot:8996361-Ditylum_brightwellii.AAC.1
MTHENQIVKAHGKKHKQTWFRASLNARNRTGKKRIAYKVNDKMTLLGMNVDICKFNNEIFFPSPGVSCSLKNA